MSVDLIGSTAFKANKRHEELGENTRSPAWIEEFITFYKQFPIMIRESFSLAIQSFGEESPIVRDNFPKIWKTIGDEIIFCNRVTNIEHAAISVSAFLKTLEKYSRRFEDDKKPLRLKGAGWLAAFPAPNISISIASDQNSGGRDENTVYPSENTEDFERSADENPSKFDFLGKGIDTGFRISKNASEDRFIASAQLAYVLAKAATKKKFPHSFGYHGREALKGVIDGMPYPIVSIDTERNEIKSQLKSREAALTGESTVQPFALCDFLETFMKAAGIDMPCLCEGHDSWQNDWPESYIIYQKSFEKELRTDEQNLDQVETSSEPENPDIESIHLSKEFLNDILDQIFKLPGYNPQENDDNLPSS